MANETSIDNNQYINNKTLVFNKVPYIQDRDNSNNNTNTYFQDRVINIQLPYNINQVVD